LEEVLVNRMSSPYKAREPLLLAAICLVALASIPLMPGTYAQTERRRQIVQVPATVDTWPAKNKRFALVIGVDEYQDTQISPLAGAANDAKALADALVRYAGFPQDQVILLASDQPLERRPTRGNILRRLSNLRGLVPLDGLLLVSFAGHGMEREGRGFLCPTDAQISGDMGLLEDTAIPVEVMRERIRQTGVKQVVVILDACRNDPSGRGESENKLTEAYARQFNFDVRNREVTAFATLYATDVGNVAYEYKEKKHGYFTWALVEGLKGAAANAEGEVTLEGLNKYVEETVPKQVALDLGQQKKQRPFAIVEGYKADELVISVAVRVPVVSGNSVAPSVDPAAIELEFWKSIEDSANADDLKAYLERYPGGQFATLAKNRLDRLAAGATNSEAPTSGAANLTFTDILGVEIGDVDANLRAALNLAPSAGGVLVRKVPRDTPGQRAGLRGGDIITAVAGESVSSLAQLNRITTNKRQGDKVGFKIIRSGHEYDLEAEIGVPLRGYEFETVKVDSRGTVVDRRKGQGRYFVEDLGGGVTLEMVGIAGGTFLMGTAENEMGQVTQEYQRNISNEKARANLAESVKWQTPQHRVAVQAVWMGKFEVTQRQWRAVALKPRVDKDLNTEPSHNKGDDLPVEQVSWDDAMEFCARLSRATGQIYRLPSESEWEYACRAGTTTAFTFGETITPDLVNYNGNYPWGEGVKGAYREKTVGVGSLGVANAFGLYDMHGNVWEWCMDNWHENYSGAPSDGSIWEGGDARHRVLRGGSWDALASFCRSAFRLSYSPDDRFYTPGFRVVVAART
jgi:formylglycine-generating enzyme required for sulfatase activity